MKITITNFYNLRFLTPNQIPLSTAMWDPKWYHDFKGPDHVFKDKHGVWNGFRAESLVPGIMCNSLCRGNPCPEEPNTCMFLRNYRKQLDLINYDQMIDEWAQLAEQIKTHEQLDGEMEIVILVHEKIDNPCSERWPLIDYFRAHGAEICSI